MSLDNYTSDKMLEQYGPPACEAANKLEGTGISDGSLTTYKPQVRQVVSELQPNPDPEDVIDYIKEVDKSGSTKNTMIMAIKKYYQAIEEFDKAGQLSNLSKSKDLAKDFSRSMQVENWVTEEEVNTILNKICPEEGEIQKRIELGYKTFVATAEHKALVATLYYTGLRVSEALMLEVDDFYFEDNEVEVYRLKKGGDVIKRDRIHQTDKYLNIITDYLDLYGIESGQIFDFTSATASNRVNDIEEIYCYMYGEFSECDNLTPHKFRHGRVTAIANQSGLEAASNYVDHENIETTQAYRHITTEDQKAMLPEAQEDESSDVDKLLEELEVDSVDELKEAISDS